MSIDSAAIKSALKHLSKHDPVIGSVIKRSRPFDLKLEKNGYRMLVYSILAQQLSTKAAGTIRGRLLDLISPKRLSPKNLDALTIEKMRSVGVSRQKASYLKDLSSRVLAGELRFQRLRRKSDAEVIAELTQVKGIGLWTAQMFLIFSLGRLDVLPHDDLGVRSAIRTLYGLDEMPDKATCHRIAEPWRPYCSIASWYCWRSFEL